MLMMMTLFYRQLSGPSNWPSYKKRCSWGSDHFPQSHLGIFFLHIQWFQCLLSVLFSCITPSTHPFVCVCVWEQAPEGIQCICKRFPSLKIVTSEIDYGLNEEFRVIPGLGEYGDRYFGTDNWWLIPLLVCEVSLDPWIGMISWK